MKIFAISDVFITEKVIRECVNETVPDAELEVFDWDIVDSKSEFQDIIFDLEEGGPDAISYDVNIIERLKKFAPTHIITHFGPIQSAMIEAVPELQAVGLMRGGTENVDVEAANQRDVPVIHTPGRNHNSVAEFTVGFILSEVKNIARSHSALKNGKWRKRFSTGDMCLELIDRTVGIVGFGNVGQRVATLLKPFGVDLLVYDPFVDDEVIEEHGAFPRSLDSLLSESDVVTLHARLTEDTRDLIGPDEIQRMTSDSYLVNTARAGLVNREALYQALRDKKIAGAALDVFWDEPITINNPFTDLDNVTLSPHYAGSSRRAFEQSPRMLLENIIAFHENSDTRNLVR